MLGLCLACSFRFQERPRKIVNIWWEENLVWGFRPGVRGLGACVNVEPVCLSPHVWDDAVSHRQLRLHVILPTAGKTGVIPCGAGCMIFLGDSVICRCQITTATTPPPRRLRLFTPDGAGKTRQAPHSRKSLLLSVLVMVCWPESFRGRQLTRHLPFRGLNLVTCQRQSRRFSGRAKTTTLSLTQWELRLGGIEDDEQCPWRESLRYPLVVCAQQSR